MKDYLVMDLENPNSRQNSICAIGLIIVRDNKIIEKKHTLINPEDSFDELNIDLTKIAPHMVKESPTLPEYWPKIKELLTNNIIIGHNITYDLRLISKSLQRYNIQAPDFKYICTLSLSRKNLELSSYKLENIAKKLHIFFNPHNAIEDARATYELFEYFNRKKIITTNQSRHYHYIPKTLEKYDPELTTKINNLYGMLRVTLFEEYITEPQFKQLEKWYYNNKQYNKYVIFLKINLKLKNIIEKGYITDDDKKTLVNTVDYIPISSIYSKKALNTQVLQGIIQMITADGKVTLEDITNLKRWLKRNTLLKQTYTYENILKIIEKPLNRRFITTKEQEKIAKQLHRIVNTVNNKQQKLIF